MLLYGSRNTASGAGRMRAIAAAGVSRHILLVDGCRLSVVMMGVSRGGRAAVRRQRMACHDRLAHRQCDDQ